MVDRLSSSFSNLTVFFLFGHHIVPIHFDCHPRRGFLLRRCFFASLFGLSHVVFVPVHLQSEKGEAILKGNAVVKGSTCVCFCGVMCMKIVVVDDWVRTV